VTWFKHKFEKHIDDSTNNSCIDKFSFGHFAFGQNLAVYLTLIAQLIFSYEIGFLFCVIYSLIAIIGWEVIEHTFVKKYIYGEGFYESISNIMMDIVIGLTSFYLLFSVIFILNHILILSLISLYFSSILILFSIFIIKKVK
jgi:hypothetical protein